MAGERIDVALLAAGSSTRFGADDKLQADLGGRPLILWSALAALGIPARRHLLVTGPGAETLPGFTHIVNAAPGEGLASSLRLAAHASQSDFVDGLLVMLADMPFVAPAHLLALCGTFLKATDRAVFTIADGLPPQPPVLFPSSAFALLRSLEGDRGARALAEDAALVRTDPDYLLDIDTPEDLDRARCWIGAVR